MVAAARRVLNPAKTKGGPGRGAKAPWPPAVIWVPAAVVGAAVLLPSIYLVLRTVGAGGDVWGLVFRPRTLHVLLRTLALVVSVTAASVAVSLPLAWLTTRTDLPLRRIWLVLTALPLVFPSYVAGLVVVAALGPRGILQQWLAVPFRVERLPDIYGFPGATLAITLVTYPYVLLTLQASMRGLDPSLEEASRSLGHGAWHTFRRVTLPQLRPAIAAGSLLAALYALRDFGGVSLLRYETFTWAIYLQYKTSFDRIAAAALATVLIVMAVGILFAEARTRGRSRYHRSAGGVARPQTTVRLGVWRWPALTFCAVIVLLALVMPLAVLGYWLFQGLAAGEALTVGWRAAINSAYASSLAAGVTIMAAIPVTILVVRYSSRASRFLDRATYLGFGLPGIVVALALVFFGARYAPPLYQTMALLVLAYLVLFLPQATGALRSSLLQVNPRTEEAARSLGHGPFHVLRTIILPLVRPGFLAGTALVFLTTMKELPATLLLSPIGFGTLATSIWGTTSEGLFAQAAVPALLLVLISAVPMAILAIRERKESS